MGRLNGKVAIVTGASRGIGLAIATRLVDEGARVTITARKPEALAEAVTALGGAAHALAVAGKSDDEAHQDETIRATLEAFGSIDLLVNNTGINPVFGRMIDLDLAAARKIVEVNCLAALSWIQRTHRAWMAEHGGAVVNISSVAGLKPAPGIGFYGASKSMLCHITEELAVELAPGVRVNAIGPGPTIRSIHQSAEDFDAEAMGTLLQRQTTPQEIAVALLYLIDASSVTGQMIAVDAGQHLAWRTPDIVDP